MTRYEIILPESGCRLTAVAETADQARALQQLGLPWRSIGQTEFERPGPARETHTMGDPTGTTVIWTF